MFQAFKNRVSNKVKNKKNIVNVYIYIEVSEGEDTNTG